MDIREKREVLKKIIRATTGVNDYELDRALTQVKSIIDSMETGSEEPVKKRKSRSGLDRQEKGGFDRGVE